MDKSKWSVHEGHCCALHGCKYGDEDCPVVSGETQQAYLCESCGYDEIESLEQLKEKIQNENCVGCDCCTGDQSLYWKDNENNAFVDNKGDVLVTAQDHTIRFKVNRCPNCGRTFEF